MVRKRNSSQKVGMRKKTSWNFSNKIPYFSQVQKNLITILNDSFCPLSLGLQKTDIRTNTYF